MKPLQRRNLGGAQTTWLNFKLPQDLHEELRDIAFAEGKTVSLLLNELIAQWVRERRKGG